MSMLLYLFFGILTTFINIYSYIICTRYFLIPTFYSTIIAWFLTVSAAYLTNKQYVFGSKSWKKQIIVKEITMFFLCRALTGALDVLIMVVCVSILNLYDVYVKIGSNILVVIVNYMASKRIVFRRRK